MSTPPSSNNGLTLKKLSILIGIYSVLIGGFIYLTQPRSDIIEIKKDIEYIRENHLPHIEENLKKNTKNINQIKLDLERIKVLLEK